MKEVNTKLKYEMNEIYRLLSYRTLAPSNHEFTTYSQIYAWTNEQLKYLFEYFYNGQESVLTVAGSGDQAINAALYGAKQIDVFDINQFAIYYFDLKIAALLSLDYQEFITFMPLCTYDNKPSEYCLNLDAYPVVSKLLKDISPSSYNFWHQLLHKKRYDFILEVYDRLLISPNNPKESAQAILCANYLKPDTYELAKRNMSQAHLNRDVISINMIPYIHGNRKFDFINFSNIAQYANYAFPNDKKNYQKSLLLYKEFLEKEIKPLLNDNGTIIANYCFYGPNDMPAKHQKAMKSIIEHDKRYTRFIVPDTDNNERILALRK